MTTATISDTAIPARLFEIVEQEIALSEEMTALLEEEKEALVAVAVQELIAITRRKNSLLQRIQAADTLLQETIGQLLADAPAAKANLSAVIGRLAGGGERDRLSGLRRRLLGLREEILSKNTINKLFAEDTQRYLNDAISLITSAAAQNHESYGKAGNRGRQAPSASRPSLISRSV